MFKSIVLQCTFGSISERFLKIWAEAVATVCGLNRNLNMTFCKSEIKISMAVYKKRMMQKLRPVSF